MTGEKALLGMKFLLAKTGQKVAFSNDERELLWHAADQLSLIKAKFDKEGYVFAEPDIEGHFANFIERLFTFSQSGNMTRDITYKESELISFYLDRLSKDSKGNEAIGEMINAYRYRKDWGFLELRSFFDHCQGIKDLTNDLN